MTWDLYPDEKGAERVVQVHRGAGFAVAGITGTMAAALAANAIVFGMRADLNLAGIIEIRRVRLQWTTLVAFTTPLTAGRRLGLYRGSGGDLSGATALTASKRDSSLATANGLSSAQIATTTGLTFTNGAREADAHALMSLSHAGAAGAFVEELFEFYGESPPFGLNPGESFLVSNPVAMDGAAGSWQLSVAVDYLVCAGKMVR